MPPKQSGAAEKTAENLRGSQSCIAHTEMPLGFEHAVASWNLRRIRRSAPLSCDQSHLLKMLTDRLQIRGNVLWCGARHFAFRPIAAVMLKQLLVGPLNGFAIGDLCAAVYGRPATMRAVRQTVFRINRAFENVDCPVAAYCRGGMVCLRPKMRSFERATDKASLAKASFLKVAQ